jgi:hypothetical protein
MARKLRQLALTIFEILIIGGAMWLLMYGVAETIGKPYAWALGTTILALAALLFVRRP